jgi:signal peptidase I
MTDSPNELNAPVENRPETASDTAPASSPEKLSRPRLASRHTLLRDAVEMLLLIATIYTLVNLATARAIVEGASMQPNFYTNQLVIVNRFAYYFGQPVRGDVVVLHNPQNPAEDFIKRVVGLPGELVEIREGRVFVNGTQLDEAYIQRFCASGCDGTWILDDEQYFVLGDNRGNSHDSHSFGPIDRKLIVGRAWIRYWPLSDVAVIPGQSYAPISQTRPPTRTPTATATILPTYDPTQITATPYRTPTPRDRGVRHP